MCVESRFRRLDQRVQRHRALRQIGNVFNQSIQYEKLQEINSVDCGAGQSEHPTTALSTRSRSHQGSGLSEAAMSHPIEMCRECALNFVSFDTQPSRIRSSFALLPVAFSQPYSAVDCNGSIQLTAK
jgi:hypothetical protein